jgi:MoaA/NifB/PqqE/SkfB family radical SAM enzyme
MISGGEPLSVANIQHLLDPLLQARKFVYLATNAGINPIAGMLADHKEHFFVLLSLWGTKEAHDQQRGTGSYQRVVRNLDQLNQLGAIGRLIVVLTSHDLGVLGSVADLVREFRIGSVVITRKLSVGRSDGPAIQLTPNFAREIADWARVVRPHVRKVFVDIPELRTLDERTTSRRSRLLGLLEIPAGGECGAGNWMMHLGPNGIALPCYAFEDRTAIGLPSALSLQQQWEGISAIRKSIGRSAACIGEMLVDEKV